MLDLFGHKACNCIDYFAILNTFAYNLYIIFSKNDPNYRVYYWANLVIPILGDKVV